MLAIADQQELAVDAAGVRAALDAEDDAAQGELPVGTGRRHRRLLETPHAGGRGLLADGGELVVELVDDGRMAAAVRHAATAVIDVDRDLHAVRREILVRRAERARQGRTAHARREAELGAGIDGRRLARSLSLSL